MDRTDLSNNIYLDLTNLNTQHRPTSYPVSMYLQKDKNINCLIFYLLKTLTLLKESYKDTFKNFCIDNYTLVSCSITLYCTYKTFAYTLIKSKGSLYYKIDTGREGILRKSVIISNHDLFLDSKHTQTTL